MSIVQIESWYDNNVPLREVAHWFTSSWFMIKGTSTIVRADRVTDNSKLICTTLDGNVNLYSTEELVICVPTSRYVEYTDVIGRVHVVYASTEGIVSYKKGVVLDRIQLVTYDHVNPKFNASACKSKIHCAVDYVPQKDTPAFVQNLYFPHYKKSLDSYTLFNTGRTRMALSENFALHTSELSPDGKLYKFFLGYRGRVVGGAHIRSPLGPLTVEIHSQLKFLDQVLQKEIPDVQIIWKN